MSLTEADTRAKLIDPALHRRGWTEDLIRPSGDAEPSDEDIRITSCIINACNLVGIKVLDHIIIGKNKEDYHSFTKSGLIR
ncbi:hypothetical protein M1O50_06180 [Dehalococcoidia bacterium]|nr:hypothetical protein [Dehalococcoidia bacterium]